MLRKKALPSRGYWFCSQDAARETAAKIEVICSKLLELRINHQGLIDIAQEHYFSMFKCNQKLRLSCLYTKESFIARAQTASYK